MTGEFLKEAANHRAIKDSKENVQSDPTTPLLERAIHRKRKSFASKQGTKPLSSRNASKHLTATGSGASLLKLAAAISAIPSISSGHQQDQAPFAS